MDRWHTLTVHWWNPYCTPLCTWTEQDTGDITGERDNPHANNIHAHWKMLKKLCQMSGLQSTVHFIHSGFILKFFENVKCTRTYCTLAGAKDLETDIRCKPQEMLVFSVWPQLA